MQEGVKIDGSRELLLSRPRLLPCGNTFPKRTSIHSRESQASFPLPMIQEYPDHRAEDVSAPRRARVAGDTTLKAD